MTRKTLRLMLGLATIIGVFVANTSVAFASPPFMAYQPKAPKTLIKE